MRRDKIIVTMFLGLLLGCNSKKDGELKAKEKIVQEKEKVGIIDHKRLFNPKLNVIYIDPENCLDKKENGTLNHPYDSFADIKWKDGITYALKRGTVLTTAKQIVISANNINLCSYGDKSERRPVIKSNINTAYDEKYAITSKLNKELKNIYIQDLEVEAPDASSIIKFSKNSENINIINCKLYEGMYGITISDSKNINIENSEIFDIIYSGIVIKNSKEIEISNSYIYNVNLMWQGRKTSKNIASGEGIRLISSDNWHIHHNYINRLNSGNKFAFSFVNKTTNTLKLNKGIFEYNIIKGPEYDGSGIYLEGGENLIIRYNYLLGTEGIVGETGYRMIRPFESHSKNVQFYGNIVKNYDWALLLYSDSGESNIYKNLFYNLCHSLKSNGNALIKLNDNLFYNNNNDIDLYCSNAPNGSNNIFSKNYKGIGKNLKETKKLKSDEDKQKYFNNYLSDLSFSIGNNLEN